MACVLSPRIRHHKEAPNWGLLPLSLFPIRALLPLQGLLRLGLWLLRFQLPLQLGLRQFKDIRLHQPLNGVLLEAVHSQTFGKRADVFMSAIEPKALFHSGESHQPHVTVGHRGVGQHEHVILALTLRLVHRAHPVMGEVLVGPCVNGDLAAVLAGNVGFNAQGDVPSVHLLHHTTGAIDHTQLCVLFGETELVSTLHINLFKPATCEGFELKCLSCQCAPLAELIAQHGG